MSANEKKFVTQSFLDQIEDEDVLAAILKLRHHGKQPEFLPVKDKTPVLHRLLDHWVKLTDEQRPLEDKTAVKNQYMDELDDDDVFAALQAMQRKIPPHMKTPYREIDLNHLRREELQLILPPSMRKHLVADEGEDGKVDESLDEVPRVESFNTLLQQTQSSKNSSEYVASLSQKSRERIATSKQYDMPEQETSIETDEIAFKQISQEETEETPAEAVAEASLQFDGVYEWRVLSVVEKVEKQEVEAQDLLQGQDHQIDMPKRRGFFKKIMWVGKHASAAASDHIEPKSPMLQVEDSQECKLVNDGTDVQDEKPKRRKTQTRRWLVNSAKTIDEVESTGSPNQSDLGPELRSFDNEDVHTQARRQSRHPRQMEQLRNRWRSARKESTAGNSHEEVDDGESQRTEVLVEERSLENQETIPSFDERHEKSPGQVKRREKLLQTRRKQSSDELADHVVPAFLPHQYIVETHADPSLSFDGALSSQRSSSLISEVRQNGALEDYNNVRYRGESGCIEKKNARRRVRLNERNSKYPHSVHLAPNVSCGAATSDDIESKVLRATDLVCGDGNVSTIKSTARTDGFKAKSNPRDRSHSFFGGRAVYQDDLIPYTRSGSSTRERASDQQGGQVFDRILDYFEEKIGCQNDELYIEGDDDESFAESSLAYSRAESSVIFTPRKTSLSSTEASTVEDEGAIAIYK
jgi:hypothetical protein